MIDTSKRFTHPSDGKRSCAAQDYVNARYAGAYDRKAVPLSWASRKGTSQGNIFFRDMDEADRITLQAGDLRRRLAATPGDRAARAACAALKARAHAIVSRYPADRDLRRFESAVALGCGDFNKAFEALMEEIAPTQRTRPGQFQTLAIAALTDARAAGEMHGRWLRQDFVSGLQTQKPSILGILGLKSDAVDRQFEYDAFSCVLNVPELIAAQDTFCNEVYGGSPAAYTCSHQRDIKGICHTTKFMPYGRPLGPVEFLRLQSRWYATALGA